MNQHAAQRRRRRARLGRRVERAREVEQVDGGGRRLEAREKERAGDVEGELDGAALGVGFGQLWAGDRQ